MTEEKIELSYEEMATHLGNMVENIAINYLKKNHVSIVEQIYSWQTDLTSIEMLKTHPSVINNQGIGTISGRKSKRAIHGWNGDLVFILNDRVRGKRAIIFEVKYGRISLSGSQIRFFNKVYSTSNKEKLMPRLSKIE